MILKNVALMPFGGLTDTHLEFQPGLNVIHGPNEAGKSTVFNAIQRVLFTRANLTSSVFLKEMAPFLPLGGGDTITVSLGIDFNGEIYNLKRRWGATRASELMLPNGSLITDDNAIQERLISILPVKERTFRTVLMTYQSGLPGTIEELQNQQEPIETLGAILRKTVFETDGISVDQFKKNIETEYTGYFSRWDRDRKCPESDRRYKKDVGKILQAHYDVEDTRAELREARLFEEEIDIVNRKLDAYAQTIDAIEIYVEQNKKVVEDARQRQSLNDRLAAIVARMEQHKKDNREWPVAENEVTRIQGLLPGLKEKESGFEAEQKVAKKKEERDTLRRKFNQVEVKQKAFGDAELALQQVSVLTDGDLDALRNAHAKLNELKAGVTASKLSVRFLAKTDLTVSVQEGLADIQTKGFVKGQELKYQEGSRLKISHQDWELDVSSGESDFEALIRDYDQTKQHFGELLEKHSVNGLEEAIKINREYNVRHQAVKSAKENLDAELAGSTYEELKIKVAEIGATEEARSLENILEDLHGIRSEIDKQEGALEQHQTKIQELIGAYESQDQLLLKLADEARIQKETQEKIAHLEPLPEGIEDIEAFIEIFETKKMELDTEKQKKSDLLIQRAEMANREPKVSVEELDSRLKYLAETLATVLKRGEAIARIKILTERLIDEMDSDTYKGLVTDLERHVISMTDNRYAKIDMEESLPRGFIRHDGVMLPCHLFSAGTRDVLALSLRLAMANHFLMDAKGMLMLDDPLVDLDPRRQKKAAEVLRNFASQKQIIVFTCHPHHLELLGGHHIAL